MNGREHGSNKKLAAQSCALSLVRQLYHLGVVEPYTGITKKKEGEHVGPASSSLLLLPLLLPPLFIGLFLVSWSAISRFSLCFLDLISGLLCSQLEPYDVRLAPDLEPQLMSLVAELGVTIPPPVS